MKDWKRAPGIMVYDASSDQELMEFGKFLMKKGELTVMAGWAGFAGVLPSLLGLEGERPRQVALGEKFLVACGSVNPITVRQLDYAQRQGFTRIRMAPHQKFDIGYYRTPEGEKNLKDWKELCSRSNRAIIDLSLIHI